MPIMDAELLLCESFSCAASSSGHVHGTNLVYIPAIKNFKGTEIDDSPNNGGKLYWNIVVEDEAFDAASDSAVVTFYLYNGDTGTAPLIDNSGVVILSQAITIAGTETTYVDGKQICSIPLPAGQLHPYFDVYVYVATQNVNTGKITSWIGNSIQQGT